MVLEVLAVDKDINTFLREQSAWNKRGITVTRVDTMGEAIAILSSRSLFFTAINADNIDYKPQLRIMRDASLTYIFIITSNFSVDEQTEAFRIGADGYAKFQDTPDTNVESALALIDRYNERYNEKSKKQTQFEVVPFGDFFFYPKYRQLFYNDTEICLTKKERDLLHYFIRKRGHPLSYEQIYQQVWGEDYIHNSKNTLNCVIVRLRKKLAISCYRKSPIKTLYQTGYRFDCD